MSEKPRVFRRDDKISIGIDTYIKYIYYLVLKWQEQNGRTEHINEEDLNYARIKFQKDFEKIVGGDENE